MHNIDLHLRLLSFECPQCANSTSQTIKKLMHNKQLDCSVCGNTIDISDADLAKKIDSLKLHLKGISDSFTSFARKV